MKCRNLDPRYYFDKDTILFHCCFELLCRFIENEYTYRKWPEYVKWCEECQSDDYTKDDFMPKHQRESSLVFDKLYKWYTSINWEDPVPYDDTSTWAKRDDDFWDLCQTNLELLVKHRGSMWT